MSTCAKSTHDAEADSRDEITQWVRENHDLLADVLRQGEDPYARACALVMLKHGATRRDIELVKEEIDEQC
jgi:hypothetical protein